jgi:exodeoxyribonuclease V beta subunit
MEFFFPIPEHNHPTLAESQARLRQMPRGEHAILLPAQDRLPWKVERGFVKGFIDFIFELNGQVYFADWKSDQLLTYSGSDFRHHIEDHYLLQAQLYTLGVIRWLKISDQESYEARFGGLFYFFLRAFAHQNERGEGVYFARPSWDEVCRYEQELGWLIDQQVRGHRVDTHMGER